MHKHLAKLVASVQRGSVFDAEGERIVVSKTSRTAGSLYEKVRNAVDYEEEHLLRRNAIRRIVRRRGVDGEASSMSRGEALLRELIWAKYLPNKVVPVLMIGRVDAVIQKYDPLFAVAADTRNAEVSDWLFDVLSTEIEYVLDPPHAQEALATLMFDQVRRQMQWDAEIADEREQDMLVYIAIHRALLRSNLATLRYRIFHLYYPTWGTATDALVAEVAQKLTGIVAVTEQQIQHPYADQLYRLMRRYALVFWAIGDVVFERADRLPSLLADPSALKRELEKAIGNRYGFYRTKRRRTVLRAVLFLFITKMLLALLIELPYDTLVFGSVHALPLLVNIVFHPLFLAMIALTASLPGKKNTDYVSSLAQGVMLGGTSPMEIVFRIKRPWHRGILGTLFSTLYALMFLVSYGLTAWVLSALLDFSWLSIALFLVFLSLVTFFGIKIRLSMAEIYVLSRQRGLIGTMFDVFMLPIIRVGRWLSLRGAKLNVFLFFLDFIVEAPFKLAIEVAESWITFVREKKEDL